MERGGGRGSGSVRTLLPFPASALTAPHPIRQDYYFYLASNLQSASNVYIDMASYEKIYDLKAEHELPERIYLDKGTSYGFSIFVTVRGHSLEFQPERGLWATLERSPRGGAGAAAWGLSATLGGGVWGRGPNPSLCL